MKSTILLIVISFIFSSISISLNSCSRPDIDNVNKVQVDAGVKGQSNNNGTNLDQDSTARIIWTVLLIIGAIFILSLLFYYKIKRSDTFKLHNNSSSNSDDKYLITELRDKIRIQEKELNETLCTIRNLNRKLEFFERELSGLKESLKKTNDDTVVNQSISPSEAIEKQNRSNPSNSTKYFKGKSGKKFTKEVDSKDDETFYCFEKNGNTGSFNFSGNQEYALGNFNAVFDNVCDYEGDSTRATKIINVEDGQVELIDGYWTVTKKAKIKVE